MRKFFVLSFCLLIFFSVEAQMPKGEFQKIYKKVVAKISSEGKDTVEFRVFRMDDFSITNLVYEKKHNCPCSDKQCHGPRLILSANFGKTKIFIFPNGDCFSETNHFSPGADIVEIDVKEEKIAEAKFKKEAEKTLLDYLKFY